MADIMSEDKRQQFMSRIRTKNTKPELVMRRGLHAMGFRYRLHDKIEGCRPDIVLKRWNVAVFVQGCFWHGHDCKFFRWPRTRPDFWRKKIEGNRARDAQQIANLLKADWRVAVIWECATRDKSPEEIEETIVLTANWIQRPGSDELIEIRG